MATSENTSNKITMATLKSFVRKNAGQLYVMNLSDFDSMTDGVRQCDGSQFRPATPSDVRNGENHTLGIAGVWLVGRSRDYFNSFDSDGFKGIEVYNSCGNFVIAIPETQSPQRNTQPTFETNTAEVN